MSSGTIWDDDEFRLRVLMAGIFTVFVLLGAAIWRLQVAHGSQYQKDLMRQSVRRVRLPGIRGCVLDRHGVHMADNRPSYCIAFYVEEMRRAGAAARTIQAVDDEVARMALLLRTPRQISREDIRNHLRRRTPLPLIAWRDLDDEAVARFVEGAANRPGVDLTIEEVRVYPGKDSACHVVGYVGRADPVPGETDDGERYHYYLPEMAGRSGVEKMYDGILRGESGGKLVWVDAAGFRYDDLALRPPRHGGDVKLTIDHRIQRAAEDALSTNNGAVVVMDPRNGDVLALASAPRFDLNRFVPSISSSEWKTLELDENKPLVHRAAYGTYPPGSIFKPLVAMAALESGRLTSEQAFDCPGFFSLGNARFRCWNVYGHGRVNLHEAIQHSCNVYFYHAGLQSGPDAILSMAQAAGLGRKTGIPLDTESAGLLPSDGWKRQWQGDGWRDGDTCNLSIGQGFLLTTPLQMAVFAGALANGGTVFRPRLIGEIIPPGQGAPRVFPVQVLNQIRWSEASIKAVRQAMEDVVASPQGTGRKAAVAGLRVAAKTGTAEWRKAENRKLAWMMAFAPADRPRVAMVVMLEDSISGGTSAAPVTRQVLEAIFQAPDIHRVEGDVGA